MPDTTDDGEEDRHMCTVGERHKPGPLNCSADASRSRRCMPKTPQQDAVPGQEPSSSDDPVFCDVIQ
jgi:hypothetical protein